MSYLGTLNSLLTSTTSRYASLRRNILSSSSEDDTNVTDPSDSHVSRVLRAYYTEKARPFPPWLGPDPKEAAKAASQQQQQAYVSTRPMGSLRGASAISTTSTSSAPPSRGGGGGGLGDIWGDSPGVNSNPVEERGSLRRGPLGGGRRAATQLQGEQGLGGNVRPLPSQRAGSYQTRDQNPSSAEGRPSSGGGGSVQERLKARLGRGGAVGGSGIDDGRGAGGGRYDGGSGRDERRGPGGGGSYATQGLSGWQGRR